MSNTNPSQQNAELLGPNASPSFCILIIYNHNMDTKDGFNIQLPSMANKALKIPPGSFPFNFFAITIHDICTVGCSSEVGIRHTAPVTDAISTVVAIVSMLELQKKQTLFKPADQSKRSGHVPAFLHDNGAAIGPRRKHPRNFGITVQT